MSTLTKFIIYQCDTCKRQTETLLDNKRPDAIRCNITYKCRGKLSRIGESSVKKFLFTPPVSGLQDYVPRGTVIPVINAGISDPDASLNVGSGLGMLTAACLTRNQIGIENHNFSILDSNNLPFYFSTESDATHLGLGIKVYLNLFQITPSLIQSKTYNYLVSGAIQIIRGPDNSPNSSSLMFNESNSIAVFSNGIKLDPSQYDRTTTKNQITLTPALYESNNVISVVVYNDLTASIGTINNLTSLKFEVLDPIAARDAAFLSSSVWGDHEAVTIPNTGTRYLLSCTDLSKLTKDADYGIASIQCVANYTKEAGLLEIGKTYMIASIGSTSFVSCGSVLNIVGQIFVATQTGQNSSTDPSNKGTAAPVIDILPSELMILLGKEPYGFQDKELNAYLSCASQNLMLSYRQDQTTGNYRVIVAESKLTQLLRPLTPVVNSTSSLFVTPSATGAVAPPANVTRKYVLGPT